MAVAATLAAGNMSTLNCPEEVWLAERLVAMHPWAEMVRFAVVVGKLTPSPFALLVQPLVEIQLQSVVITVGMIGISLPTSRTIRV